MGDLFNSLDLKLLELFVRVASALPNRQSFGFSNRFYSIGCEIRSHYVIDRCMLTIESINPYQ
jgi:hypothetical protein